MPGELGDELEQNFVGYYERRYRPGKDWKDPCYGTPASLDEEKKKKKVLDVLKSMSRMSPLSASKEDTDERSK